jgi:large repetitive protein
VENAFGCIGSDTINFKVNCDPNQLFIPNAFSPDGDGTNDVLMVRGKGISAVKYFRVFNRWGQLVFERNNINVNDPQQGWNGSINGVPAQPDVYVYTAEAVCTAGGTFVYKGNVTLVR